MGGISQSFNINLQEKILYVLIQAFPQIKVKIFCWLLSDNVLKHRYIVFRVKSPQNTMFFVLFPADMSNFAQKSRKAEFVRSLFLTNSALFQVLSSLFSLSIYHLFARYFEHGNSHEYELPCLFDKAIRERKMKKGLWLCHGLRKMFK